MKLSQHETSTPLWQKLQAYYELELAKMRNRLEAMIDDDETMRLRTRISMVKEFLAMETPSKK